MGATARVISAALLPAVGWAQTPASPPLPLQPAAAQPAAAQRAVPLTPEQLTSLPPGRRGAATPEILVPDAGPGAPGEAAAGPSFTLSAVRFDGAEALGEETLAAAVAPFVGRPIGFADLRALTEAVERAYAEAGFIGVRAIVPPQRLVAGALAVTVVEGRLVEVVIRGAVGRAGPQLRAILAPLEGARPIRAADLERRLLLARDTPGVNLVAALRSAGDAEPGAIRLIVDAAADRLDGFASVSNYASDLTGPYVGTVGVGLNGVVFSGDRIEATGLLAAQADEQALGQLRYTAPTGVDGLRVEALVSNSYSEPGGDIARFELDYEARVFRLGLEYAALRTRGRSVWLEGGFEAISQEQAASVASLAVDEELRVAFARGRLVENDVLGSFLETAATVRLGLDAFGASTDATPGRTGDPQFATLRAEARLQRAVTPDLSLTARAQGQLATPDVPSYEVFSLGNYTFGRGFDPGSASGDEGFGLSLEAAHAVAAARTPEISFPELYAFAETGRVFGEGFAAGLSSVGAGARLTLFDRVDVDAAIAVPVDSSDTVDDDGARFLFRITGFF